MSKTLKESWSTSPEDQGPRLLALAEVEGADAEGGEAPKLDMPTLVTENIVQSPEKVAMSGRPPKEELSSSSSSSSSSRSSKSGKKSGEEKAAEAEEERKEQAAEEEEKKAAEEEEKKAAEEEEKKEAEEDRKESEAANERAIEGEQSVAEEAKKESEDEKAAEEAKKESEDEKKKSEEEKAAEEEKKESEDEQKEEAKSEHGKGSESSDSESSSSEEKDEQREDEPAKHETSEEVSTTTMEDDFLSESSAHQAPASQRKPNVMEQLQELKKSVRDGSYSARSEWLQLDDETCAQILSRFEKKGKVPERRERDAVLKYVRREVTKAMANKEYKKADRMNDLNTRLLTAIAEADKADYAVDRGEIIAGEIQATKDRMTESEKQWQDKFKTMRQDEDAKEEELKRTHKEQVRDFDEYYDDVDHLRPYSKPSAFLLHLRCRERSMVMCNRFMDAKAMSNEADRLEKAEAAKAQALAAQEITGKRNNLLKKQAGEVQRARNYYDKHVEKNKKEMEKEMNLFQRRIHVLERNKEGNTTESLDFYATCPEPPGVRSPRTRQQYNQFRNTAPVGKLKLQPLIGLAAKCPRPVKPRVTKTSVSMRKSV